MTNSQTAQHLLTKFVENFPLQSFEAKSSLILAGKTPEVFYYLVSGCVKLSQTSVNGRVSNLHLFYPNSCISLLTLLPEKDQVFDYVTVTPVQVHKIPRTLLLTFLENQPEVSLFFLQKSMAGMKGLLERVSSAQSLDAYQQVANLVFYYAKHGSTKKDGHPDLSLMPSHQEIADWLGMSREHVSIQMKKLENAGILQKSTHGYDLKNPELLYQLTDHEQF